MQNAVIATCRILVNSGGLYMCFCQPGPCGDTLNAENFRVLNISNQHSAQMAVEQICNERRLFRGSLLGWGAGGTQWGVCYFSPSRAIAHKLTSSQCKCLFTAKILNSILVLEWPQHSIRCPSVFAPFKTRVCFRNRSKTARGILTEAETASDKESAGCRPEEPPLTSALCPSR